MNNFISFSDIKPILINENLFNSNGNNEQLLSHTKEKHQIEFPIYQIQSSNDKTKAVFMHIGFMYKLCDVFIKQFDIYNKYKCFIVSKIYNQINIQLMEKNNKFPIIVIIISLDSTKLNPLAWLCFNFNINDIVKNNIKLIECLSKKDSHIDINGFYSISLHFLKHNSMKFVNLETFEEFPNIDNIMILLTKWLLDDYVLDILNKLT